ncbi:MAG TPA: N-carbamoyl-D-amino-acid hydrolase [Hypericibacter adhaerens]|jgi:predicted amidohydrolase|uniref:N-carbamoyl-D-amino-acid hydrolase n=1 Tax=Hypericibacter adhaerens TaxID=2602016 RepID=UPI002B710E9E|nr:N-carbamoyl-D-amino-acid hydrolase [Hypericibacter adhaerens]HWA46318.1 N-carbamoyl-D-amino-acid hydrolase [Hypericibacter adhaerens]
MARTITVGAAQLGPIARHDTRRQTVSRLLELMREAHGFRCDLIAYPELALTTFFPRWPIEDEAELDSFYETEMPGPETRPLFEEAARRGIGFSLGFAELVIENGRKRRFNSSILVDKTGRIVGKYRKVHLPGHSDVMDRPGQHLEKRFFEVGDLGFPVWRAFGGILGMCICNDRRWPETYRVMGLQGVEMVLLGYNSPIGLGDPFELDALEPFHNHLVMQSGAYQNATWVVGVAKAGLEEGFNMIGQTCIIAPSGEIVAQCATMGDELIVRKCDLDMGAPYRADIFNFAYHRRIEHYKLITERTGAIPPPETT